VSVFLCNSPTSLSFKIVNAWIWISLRSVDFEVPAHSRPWTFPGAEIWVNFKDTTTDEVMASLDPTIYGLFQDPGVLAPHGFEIPGGIDDGYTPFDIDNVNEAGKHEHLAVNFYGIDYCQPGIIFGGLPPFRCLLPSLRSTRLDPGEYSFEAYTHGYVMRRSFPMQVPLSGMADIEADLIQGGQIRVTVNFKHEAVATDFNGFIRVEVFNADNEMVGASIYGQAQPNRYTIAGDGGAYLGFDPITDHMLVPGPAAATGLDTDPVLYPSSTLPGVNDRQRAFYSMSIYGIPASTWASWDIMTPSDANRFLVSEGEAGGAQSIDVYGFYWYVGGPARTWAGGWPTTDGYNNWQKDYGLKGSNDIPLWAGSGGGLYTVKVWAFDPYGPDGYWNDEDDLLGAGDDWRMYSMGWDLTNVEVPWGGTAQLFVTMNNLASLRGTVRWFDMFGNLRALPWAQISASLGPASDQIPAYSAGYGLVGDSASAGSYIMWLPAGTHDISITTSEAPGVWSSSAPTSNVEYTVLVSDGWVGGGDSQLSGSGTPVPELPSFVAPLSLFAALAASVWLLRKRTLNVPVRPHNLKGGTTALTFGMSSQRRPRKAPKG
jgi:hypothetical protein